MARSISEEAVAKQQWGISQGMEVPELLKELKLRDGKSWMMITNQQGALVQRSLWKLCATRGISEPTDAVAGLKALLDEADDDDLLSGHFHELCRAHGVSRLCFEDVVASEHVAQHLDVHVTLQAAKKLWADRDSVTCPEFVAFIRGLRDAQGRATTIQSFLRGRAQRLKPTPEAEALRCGTKLAPYNPTPMCAIHQALEALSVRSGDVVYDLGCGDGRFLIAAGQRGARAVGVEYDPRFAERALRSVQDKGLREVSVICGDACVADLSEATQIFVYLVPQGLKLLEPNLREALQRGVRIASYTFSLPGWTPDDVLTAESRSAECKLWIYKSARCLS